MKKSLFKGVLFLIIILMLYTSVSAGGIDQVQVEKSTVDTQLAEAKNNKEAYEAQLNSTKNELQYVINSKNWVMNELEMNEQNINNMTNEINNLSKSIDTTEADYNNKLEQLKGRLRVMYRNSNSSKLEFLIESGSLSEFFQRVRWLSRIFSKDREVMSEFAAVKKDLEEKKSLVVVAKNNTQNELEQNRNEIFTLNINRASVEERIQITKSNLDYWANVENQFAQKSLELQKIIMSLSGSGEYSGGGMAWPTPGHGLITQYYGTFIHAILGDYRNHFAIDIGAPYGATIIASNSGTVINCGWIDGYGYTVIIDHGGGISTLYAHASSLATYRGAYVERGSIIAYIGSTGMSTGPHLHYEVRVNGVCVNPLDYTSP